jgi:hypothetical protein
MIDALAVAAAALLGGFLNRVRGGLWRLPSTQAGRAIFAFGAGAVAGLELGEPWALAVAPCLFLALLPGWGEFTDLGRMGGDPLEDAARLAGRGAVLGVAMAGPVYLAQGSPWPVLAAGIAMPACYELGWRTPIEATGFARGPEIAEVYFGAAIFAALALS